MRLALVWCLRKTVNKSGHSSIMAPIHQITRTINKPTLIASFLRVDFSVVPVWCHFVDRALFQGLDKYSELQRQDTSVLTLKFT